MTPENARKTLINTDYPLDKLVYVKEQAISIGTGGTVNIAHGLPFTPLVSFQWSFTPDFAVSYENNTGAFPSGNPGYFFTLQIAISANATNVRFDANGTLGTTTVYVRVIAYLPDDVDMALLSTDALADPFVLNSDKNYLKLVASTHFSLNAGATSTVNHNLGYKPQVMAWGVTSGTAAPMDFAWPTININLEVTDTQFIFRNESFSNAIIYYRYYLDD